MSDTETVIVVEYTAVTAIAAEGARVGLASCQICGATVLLDERDDRNMMIAHTLWHQRDIRK